MIDTVQIWSLLELPEGGNHHMNNNKHLTASQRSVIESELCKGTSFKKIGSIIEKDCSTVSKEVRAHIQHEQTGCHGRKFNNCIHAVDHSCRDRRVCHSCTLATTTNKYCWSCGRCISCCSRYEAYVCPKLTKPPYVCNACHDRSRCSLEKATYSAFHAQKEYEEKLRQSRTGFNISEKELRHLDDVLSPLIKNGQSIHHISVSHADELMLSERTMYTYVNNGLLKARNIDMPRTIRMKPRKGRKKDFKVDKACRHGRTWDDYQLYLESHPDAAVRELDSVEGVKGGKVLLTIHFVKQDFQLAFLRDSNDSKSVTDIFNLFYNTFGKETFMELFPLLLADNGSEFSNPKALEFDSNGNQRTHVFYCNPSAPYQKGSCENNHEMIRRIIPKAVDIGRYSQEQINLMMSHINSYARQDLGNKTPYDMFSFIYGEDILKQLGITRIAPDDIILKPALLEG